ncbi:MAG: hypothetical protein Q4F67_10495 [Propionibacteriaceae bacterium]|nr:hypothetical protein [Propionibacteriaceae bacterium]
MWLQQIKSPSASGLQLRVSVRFLDLQATDAGLIHLHLEDARELKDGSPLAPITEAATTTLAQRSGAQEEQGGRGRNRGPQQARLHRRDPRGHRRGQVPRCGPSRLIHRLRWQRGRQLDRDRVLRI